MPSASIATRPATVTRRGTERGYADRSVFAGRPSVLDPAVPEIRSTRPVAAGGPETVWERPIPVEWRRV